MRTLQKSSYLILPVDIETAYGPTYQLVPYSDWCISCILVRGFGHNPLSLCCFVDRVDLPSTNAETDVKEYYWLRGIRNPTLDKQTAQTVLHELGGELPRHPAFCS